jgi:hypothetical protein
MKIPPQIPPTYEPSHNPYFGIYLRTRKTGYGHCDIGKFKGNNIEIYHDNETKSKLYYVSDNLRNWIKSKLIYFERGFKRIVRSENARIY